MLSKKRQIKFFRKNHNKIIFHMWAFCENKNTVHKMRVAIKKLNAFIYFLKKHSHKKHFRSKLNPIKKIFKHAGLIRNAQVNLELAGHFHIRNKNFREEQAKTIDSKSEEFCLRHKAAISVIKRSGKQILPYFRDIKNKRILNFFKREIKKSGNNLKGDLNTEEWHSCRKKIKILLYVYQFLGRSVAKKIPLNISYLDDSQELIGKWHDTVMASGLIHPKTKSAKASVKKLMHESELQKEEFISKIHGFMKKATQQ